MTGGPVLPLPGLMRVPTPVVCVPVPVRYSPVLWRLLLIIRGRKSTSKAPAKRRKRSATLGQALHVLICRALIPGAFRQKQETMPRTATKLPAPPLYISKTGVKNMF